MLAANNLTSEWSKFPGRLLTTIFELNMTILFIISIVFVVCGVGLMLTEYFSLQIKSQAEICEL